MTTNQTTPHGSSRAEGWAGDGELARSSLIRRQGGELARAHQPAERRARGLGWFSIGLGLAHLVAPRRLAKLLGVRDDARNRAMMRAVGLREIVSGVGLLARPRPVGWTWTRVAGDVMDLGLLRGAFKRPTNDHRRIAAATAAVVGITLIDLMTGQQLSRSPAPAIHVARAITVNRPIDEVFGFWRDFENLPLFLSQLESVDVSGSRLSRWRAKTGPASIVEWDVAIVDDRPSELIAWQSLAGAEVTTSGAVGFNPAPGGRGTEVHVELRYERPGGVAGSPLGKLLGKDPGTQLEGDLRRFKQVMEVGEVVHSDASIFRGPHPARPSERFDAIQGDTQ